jgi:DNA-binding response OmpR family regulator
LKRILVIEDDTNMRETIRDILQGSDIEVFEAPNGKVGLELHALHPFDLIITDIIMPEMDGLEVIMSLRTSYPATPVLTISGGGRLGADEYLAIASELGASHTLSKPFELSEMVSLVEGILCSVSE